jgi:quercetin dioxygenase-like cupin family protein
MNDRREFLQSLIAAAAAPPGQQAVRTAREIQRQPLPAPFEGMEATYVGVTIPPGPGSPAHRHSGFMLGYVLEGEFLFATDGGTPRVVKAGESFYEPTGAVRSTSASALSDRPVTPLAVAIFCRIVHCRINSLLRPMRSAPNVLIARILSILIEDVAFFAMRSPRGLFIPRLPSPVLGAVYS